VLPLVLAVVVLSVSVAMGVLWSASTRVEASEGTWRRQQLRALALSGVRLAMAELESQREALLDGGTPVLTRELVLYSDGTGRGVATLLPLSEGTPARSELTGLDLNRATAEMLSRLPGVSGALAAKIVAERGPGYTSVEEVGPAAAESGLEIASIYGRPGEADAVSAPTAPALLSMLSVYGFDPEVQQGVGREGRAWRGRERERVTAEWVRDHRRELAARFGESTAEALERLAGARGSFESRSALVRALLAGGVPVESWAGILDVAGVGDDRFARGVVDLNLAPTEVLAAIPGLDEASASAIVARRDGVDGSIRGSIAWPVVEGVLEPSRLAEAADWLSARSLVWRVRVRGVIEPPVEAEGAAAVAGGVVFEAVIDLSGDRARLAYLREVTSLPLAVWMSGRAESSGPGPIAEDEESAPAATVDREAPRIERLSIRGRLSLSRLGRPEGADDGGSSVGARGEGSEADGPPPARQDRRIGRWTPGPRGGETGRSGP
jgi:DNA uptake protein ComE-like DNA-binding protein